MSKKFDYLAKDKSPPASRPESPEDPEKKRKQMQGKGLALQQMLNAQQIDTADPENVKFLDNRLIDKMEVQDYEVKRKERKEKWKQEEALR